MARVLEGEERLSRTTPRRTLTCKEEERRFNPVRVRAVSPVSRSGATHFSVTVTWPVAGINVCVD